MITKGFVGSEELKRKVTAEGRDWAMETIIGNLSERDRLVTRR